MFPNVTYSIVSKAVVIIGQKNVAFEERPL